MTINFQVLRVLVAGFGALVLAFGCVGTADLPSGSGPGANKAGAGGSGGASVSCPIGQSECGGTCVDLSSNPRHCGTCGTACGAGSSCEAGKCETFCATGQLECGGDCRTVASDLGNCGACGAACAPGQFCSSGVCGAECPFQTCQGPSGLECADLQSNPDHCGACGAACPEGKSCVAGSCKLVCPTGKTACGDSCIDTSSDAANCGTCGNACAAGVPCIGGACGCPAGQALCGGVCVEVQADAANCGACGKACTASELCEAGACKPSSEGCSPGLTACSGACVNTQSSNAHCGTCINACTGGRTCSAGQCVCGPGQQFCNGACVDTVENPNHCGACGVVCDAGRSCVQGKCECAGGLEFCGSSCVDTKKSNEHCGKCQEECVGGQSCQAGTCECPAGQTFCGENCVDVNSSDLHCGACGKACALGKSCISGSCTGGGGTGEDGCSGFAKDLTVSQVAVYQSVKIPVMNDGVEIAPANRVSEVVAGRETLFRVFVNVAQGFSAREISARLIVMNDGTPTSYYQKKTISKNSTESDPATTFQLFVPKDQIKVGTTFYVETVECGEASGTVTSPRYPAGDAEAALGAREMGVLKVKIVPIRANNSVPDTSPTALEVYRSYLLAMYPVSDVELSVADELSVSYPINWNNTLDAVRARRNSATPSTPPDVYYYGLLKPVASFNQFCGNGCTTGIGFVSNQASYRAALGVGFADNVSVTTMAHELGHNHGRNHAPCGGPDGVDPQYPYNNALVGVWGYDYREKVLIDPTNHTDIMAYCNSKWISDYTYNGILRRIAQVNGALNQFYAPGLVRPWRVLLVDSHGPRWGYPMDEPVPPNGDAEPAEILDAQGDVLTIIDVYRTEIGDMDAASIQVPVPEPDWHAIRVAGYPPLAFGAPVTHPAP